MKNKRHVNTKPAQNVAMLSCKYEKSNMNDDFWEQNRNNSEDREEHF